MKRFILTVTFSFLLSLPVIGQINHPIDVNELDQAMERFVQNNNIPSLAVGIIQNGQLIHVISKGETKRGSGIAIDEKAQFQIGSLSKSFTALLLTHLDAEGLIDLNRSVASYMKDELSEGALKEMSQITLINLLQHTAGLPNNGKSIPATPNGTAMKGGYTQENLITDLNELKLDKERMGKWNYSNLGFGLLGHIAEKVTGKTYEELLKQYILEPNAMTSTTSVLANAGDQMVTPYMIGGDRTKETQAWEMGKNIAAGGIVSTIEDLSKLLIAEMKAYESFEKNGIASPMVLVSDITPINYRMNYGYGFMKTRNAFDSTIVQLGHGGDLDGFGSNFEFYPEQNIAMVMLTGSGGNWFNDAKTGVESVILGIDLPKEVALDKATIKAYTGKYDFGKNQVLSVFRKGNKLYTYFKGQDPVNLYASAENKFFYLSQNSQLEFELDKKGKVAKATYIQNGKEFYPKKIK